MNGGNNKSRNNLRSPQTHNLHSPSDQIKTYKRKYEQAKEQLKQEKRMNEQISNHNRQIQHQLKEQEKIIHKQERELQKKEEINEVLLERIKCLKGALAQFQSKKNNDSSYEDKNYTKSNKSSTSNQEHSGKNQPVVGGYFGSIFK